MQLHFRTIRADEVEKELTQRDQFNSDEVELIEALVREAHQNSLDAQPKDTDQAVQTRIAFHSPTEEERKFLAPILTPLQAHLSAAGVDCSEVDFGNPQFLVIEDFGTTGLIGAWDRKDDNPFSDFWRRVGKSHKGGSSGGRWGLGKLVFSSASQARAFFGLTIRRGDATNDALVMGQAVLSIHKDPATGDELDGVGFFCDLADNGLQLPVRDAGFVEKFASAVGFTRQTEPGLSIAIPYVRSDLAKDGLIRSLLRNYYFPILIGQLESEIAGTQVNSDTFDALARTYGGDRLSDGRVISFVRDLRKQLDERAPDLALRTPLGKELGSAIEEKDTEALRARFAAGNLVHVRVPVMLKHRKKGQATSSLDLFLRLTDGDGQGLVVRGGITLPLEGTEFRSRKCFGALIAAEDVIAEFLGDAENPAHTRWNRNAEKLNANWVNGSSRLSEVRGSLNSLYNLLAQSLESVEKDAFLDVFSIPGPAGTPERNKKHVPERTPVPEIPRKPALFAIGERKGGFTVKATTAVRDTDLPMSIRIQAAYDLLGGDPFKRHSEVDFDFRQPELKIDSQGATLSAETANILVVEATSPTFALSITGFDENRDLVVQGRRVR